MKRVLLAAALTVFALEVTAGATPVPRPPCQAQLWGPTFTLTWENGTPHVGKQGATGYWTDCPQWLLK